MKQIGDVGEIIKPHNQNISKVSAVSLQTVNLCDKCHWHTLFCFCEKIENFRKKLKKIVILHDALNSTKTIQIPAKLRMRVCNQGLVHCTQFLKKF